MYNSYHFRMCFTTSQIELIQNISCIQTGLIQVVKNAVCEYMKDLRVRKWIYPNCKTYYDRNYNVSYNIILEGLKKYMIELQKKVKGKRKDYLLLSNHEVRLHNL